MATITFNPPQGLAETLNIALSDGRYIRLEAGRNEYPDDATYLLKKSTNNLVKAYMASMNIVIEMDDSDGVKSVLMSNSVSPFAPLSPADLGMVPTGINTSGFGNAPNPLNTPSPSQVITPTTIPVNLPVEDTAPTGTPKSTLLQQQALLNTEHGKTEPEELEDEDLEIDEEEYEEEEEEETEEEEEARLEEDRKSAEARAAAAAKKSTKATASKSTTAKSTTSKRRSLR